MVMREEYQYRKTNGLCVKCGEKAKEDYTCCVRCFEKGAAKRKKNREEKTSNGLCTIAGCTRAVDRPGKKMCNKCIELGSQRLKIRREKFKEAGKCTRCGTDVVDNSFLCDRCKGCASNNSKQFYERRKAEGVCPRCGTNPITEGQKSCEPCRLEDNRQTYVLKLATLSAYGGPKCTCCGETRIEFLTLEHPNNDGKEHREKMKAGSRTNFYDKLRIAGFPQDVKMIVHCFNCNIAKGFYGYCPHEREKAELITI